MRSAIAEAQGEQYQRGNEITAHETPNTSPGKCHQQSVDVYTENTASRRYKLKNNLTLSHTLEHEQNYQHKN